MALGPGKYDDLCTHVREEAQARGVLLFVLEGSKGTGFAAQGPLAMQLAIPTILRNVADQIDADIMGFIRETAGQRQAPGEGSPP